MSSVWETHASWWAQTFADGTDDEYEEQILPLARRHLRPNGTVLDIGTGEGQLGRVAIGVGCTTFGVDSSAAMVRHASARSPQLQVTQADVTSLPFADETFDAVTAGLVMEHVTALAEAVAEVARVIKTGGTFLLFLNHPLVQAPGSGWIEDHVLEERYWRVGPYLRETYVDEEVEAGVHIPFHHRPLGTYVNLLSHHGLYVTEMAEPSPPAAFLEANDEDDSGRWIPRLLMLHCGKHPRTS